MTLQSIRIDEARRLIYANAAASFPAQAAASVLNGHQLLREGALLKVEVEGVQADKSRKEHVVCLLLPFQIVSENEAALLAGVTMQVNIEFQVAQVVLGNNRLLDLVDCRLLVRTGAQIEPVQIVIVSVQAIVATRYAVRVDQGYDLDDVIFKNDAGLLTFGEYEVNDTIKYMRRLYFSWMDSRAQKDCFLVVESMASFFVEDLCLWRSVHDLGQEALAFDLWLPLFAVVVVSCDRDEFHVALLQGVAEQLSMKIDFV